MSSTNPGFLQLTDTRGNVSGGVVYNKPIPANGGLDVTFDQYQYGGTGADGIGFFLSDGSKDLTSTGAIGGSLGYAPNTSTDGVNGGYFGVGLDAFGNYSNPTEGRDTGCTAPTRGPGPRANSIALRGPGQGKTGYCYLGGTAAGSATFLRASSTNLSTSNPAAGAGRSIRVTVSAETRPLVIVYRGTSAGAATTEVFRYRMTTDTPATYKLGFVASTGGSTDTHLIRNVSVSSVEDLGALNLVKQIDQTTTQPASYKEGDRIPYSFVVTNPSQATLSNVAVNDPKIANVSCPATTLAPLASVTCTGSYTVTAADAVGSAREVTNTATATAQQGTTTITSNVSTATAPLTAPSPALGLTKTGNLADTNGNGAGDPGEKVTYSFTARNTGNVTLSGVTVTDPKVTGITPATATIAPGATATFTSAAYTITQADVDAGTALRNTATATGRTGVNVTVSSAAATADTPIRYTPQLSLTKTGALPSTTTSTAGDTVRYSFTVENTGNVAVTGVGITDPLAGLSNISFGAWPGTTGALSPGQKVTATATYPLKQSDIDAGKLANTATATGQAPNGSTVTRQATHTLTVPQTPKLALTKTADRSGITAAGEKITYTFTATNTGNTTLTGVRITDPKAGLSTITYGTWPGAANTLGPGQKVTATATYTVTTADMSTTAVSNTATATGTPGTAAAITTTATSTVAVRPDPRADQVRVTQGEEITFNVLANDGPAAEGATFTRAQASPTPKLIGEATGPVPVSPAHGSITCIDSGPDRGQCTYRSLDSYTGTDGFDYALRQSYQTWNVHVAITVVPTNHTPTARADRAVATAGGDPVTIRPLTNDSDPDTGDTLVIAEATAPASTAGQFSCTDTECTYTPEDDWTGIIEIPYTVTDRSTTDPGPRTAASTIRIYVDPPPLDVRGFHDRASTDVPVAAGVWQETTTITGATPMCAAGRPATRITWAGQQAATGWMLERRLAPAGGTDPAWQRVASLGAGTTEFTDTRLGEGRTYQWRTRPDLHRWEGTPSTASPPATQPSATTAAGC
ncbi:Ig-like domain-containing protein [Kocuria sp. NPDC057446]|uniref:DUF7507 domain-containing protein n=1 Tax=Kocuria sp. NPDC057446 TaxID=3346137 RepID=UPI0036BAF8D5